MQLIEMPGVVVADLASRRTQVLDYAQKVFQLSGRSKLALAACLHEIKDKDYWDSEYESFDQYVYKVFGYSSSTSSALMQVYEVFIARLKVDPDTIDDVSWAKLAMLTPTISVDTMDELLEIARHSTQGELKKHLKDMQGLHVTETKTGTGTKFTFTVSEDQAEVIKEAIKKAEEAHAHRDDLPPGLVYETIFADYLIADCDTVDEEHLTKALEALGRIHGVKIEWDYE